MFQRYQALLGHRAHLDVQVIQDRGLQDHLDLQVSQATEDQDLKETKETQASHPALVHFTRGHLDHLDLLDLLDQKAPQVLLDHEDIKVIQANQEDQEPQKELQLIVEEMGFQDHLVHQDLKDFQDHKELKGILEFLESLLLQESPQGLLVLQVHLVLQAGRVPSLLLLRCTSTSLNT